MARQDRMITAVNRQIRALPQEVQDTDARCEMARQLAEELDAGHDVYLKLARVLDGLAKTAKASPARKPAAKASPETPTEPERTWVERIDDRRLRRLATAADSEHPARGDDRRAGGS